jgi:hypothetical protein
VEARDKCGHHVSWILSRDIKPLIDQSRAAFADSKPHPLNEGSLIFYGANSQAIECAWKSEPTKLLGTAFRMISRDLDQVSVT